MNSPLFDHLRPLRGAMLDALKTLVDHESPSLDKIALDTLAETITTRFQTLGLSVDRIGNATGGDHLRIRLDSKQAGPPALVLCHFDTVWRVGTLARMPFRVDEDHAHGPGVYDMKASLVVAEFAVRAILSGDVEPPRPVVFLFTSDEEIGSPDSRPLIEAEAQRSAFVLVLEPPLSDGRLKTARKGVGRFTLTIQGRAAHAGVEPEKGLSAVTELAHQILAINALADPSSGTTINVGLVQGGTTTNVVPALATAEIDVRVTSQKEADRISSALGTLRPVASGVIFALRGGFNRPPMERTPEVASLFDRVRDVGRSLGLDFGEGSTGGGSDANFTASLGLPTLDGLGVPGAGAHATHEHILIDALPERAAFLAELLLKL